MFLSNLTSSRARLLAIATGALWLTACQTPPPPAAPQPPSVTPAPVTNPPPAPVVAVPLPDPLTHADRASRRLLGFQAHLATLRGAALSAEIASLEQDTGAEPTQKPDLTLALVLALMQERAPGDLKRADALLSTLRQSTSTDLAAWQDLIRFVGSLLSQQRQLQDQLDQEVAQHRDIQRQLDQTTEKLEALKAIERSLGGRVTPSSHTP